MPKKPEKKSAGVPEWVVTYGDMMSLLLCFFILLAAFSEMKKDEEYQRVVEGIKEAFGYSGGVGVLPSNDVPLRSMIEMLESAVMKEMKQTKVSNTTDEGPQGKEAKVTKVHEGMMFTIGGNLTFEPGSAELKPEAKREIVKVCKLLDGRQNKIAVRGHAARKRLPPDSPFKDLTDLSYARAKAAYEVMVNDGGLNPEVLYIEARGDNEPLNPRQTDEKASTANRRVEIIMTEVLVTDLNHNDYSDEGAAVGATGGSSEGG